MADTITLHYSLVKPEVGASNDSWGTKTNGNWEIVDVQLKSANDAAASAMPKTGGLFTNVVRFMDAGFYINFTGNVAFINFNDQDYMSFDRDTNTLNVVIDGVGRFSVSANGVATTGPMNIAGRLTNAGNDVWTTGNDGHGSGLDADLLDGQQGGWFADIAGRLGFNPADRAGQTFDGRIGRDANFYFDVLGGDPIINLDTNDFLLFERANNKLVLVMAGSRVASIDGAGTLTVRGNIAGGGTP